MCYIVPSVNNPTMQYPAFYRWENYHCVTPVSGHAKWWWLLSVCWLLSKLLSVSYRGRSEWVSEEAILDTTWSFFSAHIKTCHSGKSTGVTNNINVGSVLLSCPSFLVWSIPMSMSKKCWPNFIICSCAHYLRDTGGKISINLHCFSWGSHAWAPTLLLYRML